MVAADQAGDKHISTVLRAAGKPAGVGAESSLPAWLLRGLLPLCKSSIIKKTPSQLAATRLFVPE
jgi:hypothetical protein